MIVKAQLPLASSGHAPMMLVYNQDRSIEQLLPLAQEWVQLFPAGQYKVYVRCDVTANEVLVPQAVVADQPW